ncbi:ABC transporter ATP-binding protein [Nocardia sp. Marseille-Q1738]
MIEFENVGKHYKVGNYQVNAVQDVSLKITAGEFVAIVGPSGSGKSTLLHLAGALESPDQGTVRFESRDIGALNSRQRSTFRRHQVGFVFQFFNLVPTMSAWENVAVPRLLDGQSLRSAKVKALELLERVGLAERANHRPAELSGGQRQRVAIARALVMDPPLILADEPTGNLDTATGAAVLELLSSFPASAERRQAVVMVTHDLTAAAMAYRVITMQDGTLL